MSRHRLRNAHAGLLAGALALLAAPVSAQHTGHEGHVMPAAKPPPKKRPAMPVRKKPAATPARARPTVDHAAMGHGPGHGAPAKKRPTKPAAKAAPKAAARRPAAPASTGHAGMHHRTHAPAPASAPKDAADHAGMDHAAMGHAGMDHAAMGHEGMDHAAMGHGTPGDLPADAAPRTPIPALTAADRAAAFPVIHHGHEVHDRRIHSYWLVDRLEWQDSDGGALGWEGLAWIGGDIHRAWLRTEGEASDGEIESGTAEVLYGRALTPWWDGVVGVRHDFGHGPSRTYAAFGVQGLAPYKFEVEATAFVGAGGRGGASVEAEYETLVTNRLILQWQGEANLYTKDDPELGVASGLSSVEAGARLRYEFTRRFAPYVGVEVERALGGTADLRREHGEPVRDTRLVAGLRFWF